MLLTYSSDTGFFPYRLLTCFVDCAASPDESRSFSYLTTDVANVYRWTMIFLRYLFLNLIYFTQTFIIIIIIIIIIILVITLMHGVYNYIPETNRVTMLYSVAAVLYLQFVLHVMLFIILNMFCTFTSALPAVCVQCTVWPFFAVP